MPNPYGSDSPAKGGSYSACPVPSNYRNYSHHQLRVLRTLARHSLNSASQIWPARLPDEERLNKALQGYVTSRSIDPRGFLQ
jgi:hypothetical protein